jgi:hypothetical protein
VVTLDVLYVDEATMQVSQLLHHTPHSTQHTAVYIHTPPVPMDAYVCVRVYVYVYVCVPMWASAPVLPLQGGDAALAEEAHQPAPARQRDLQGR